MKTKQELRDKFFKECTCDLQGIKKVNMTAHDMFEWFWNNLQELNQTEHIKSVSEQSDQFICPCCNSNNTYVTDAIHCNRCAVTTEI